MLPFVFEDGFGFERYVDYALDVPMYFVIRNGSYVNVAGESLPRLPRGQAAAASRREADRSRTGSTTSRPPSPKSASRASSRCAAPTWATAEFIPALSAFWAGLLYDELSLDAAWDIVKDWTAADRAVLRNAVPKTALHTPIPGSKLRFGTVADLAREIVGISEAGLVRRALTNDAGEDETIYLEPLEKILTVVAKTPAEDLLDALRRRWGRDVNPIFERNRDFSAARLALLRGIGKESSCKDTWTMAALRVIQPSSVQKCVSVTYSMNVADVFSSHRPSVHGRGLAAHRSHWASPPGCERSSDDRTAMSHWLRPRYSRCRDLTRQGWARHRGAGSRSSAGLRSGAVYIVPRPAGC